MKFLIRCAINCWQQYNNIEMGSDKLKTPLKGFKCVDLFAVVADKIFLMALIKLAVSIVLSASDKLSNIGFNKMFKGEFSLIQQLYFVPDVLRDKLTKRKITTGSALSCTSFTKMKSRNFFIILLGGWLSFRDPRRASIICK